MDQYGGENSSVLLDWSRNFFPRYYLGVRANVVITDVEMLKQVLVKDFDCFVDREVCVCVCMCL